MAVRSIASVTVCFGLVSIPVKVYSASESSHSVSFNFLHKGCGSRLKQQYVCVKEGTVVEREDMVKGYEFSKDQYVTFTPTELKQLEETGSGMVELSEFVATSAIDPIFYDKAYYLAPDKGGARSYALLAEGLRKTARCAVGRWAARGKQYIVVLRPVPEGLVMQQLRYADEVRTIDDVDIPTTEVRDQELTLAVQLIEQTTNDHFDPSIYKDEVKARIEAAVAKKLEGQEIAISAAGPEAGAQVIDLMEALRASLAKRMPAPTGAPAVSGQRKPAKRVAAQPASSSPPASLKKDRKP